MPWLDNSLTPGHVDDKGDVWHSSQEIWSGILSTQELVSAASSPEKKKEKRKGVRKSYQQFTILGYVLESLKKLLYFSSYVMAVSMNLRAVLLMELSIESFEFWTCVISTVCTSLISHLPGHPHLHGVLPFPAAADALPLQGLCPLHPQLRHPAPA